MLSFVVYVKGMIRFSWRIKEILCHFYEIIILLRGVQARHGVNITHKIYIYIYIIFLCMTILCIFGKHPIAIINCIVIYKNSNCYF